MGFPQKPNDLEVARPCPGSKHWEGRGAAFAVRVIGAFALSLRAPAYFDGGISSWPLLERARLLLVQLACGKGRVADTRPLTMSCPWILVQP